jgi:hypothetical protein
MNQVSKSSTPQRHKRHDGHRSAGSGSGNTSSRSNPNKYIRDCACARGMACVGMTQAFRLLGDPRCYYVELPRFRKDPPAYKYVFRNNLRAAYLRHLCSFNPDIDLVALEQCHDRRYVALHHFHPAVVRAFYDNPLTSGAARKHKVPISITEHELQELNMDIHQEDRILSVTGVPTGGFYFCPSYAHEKAHEDLKQLIKRERAIREEKVTNLEKPVENIVPENIEISKQINSSPTPSAVEPASASKDVQTSTSPQETEKLAELHSEDLVTTLVETETKESNTGQSEEHEVSTKQAESISKDIRETDLVDTDVLDSKDFVETAAETETKENNTEQSPDEHGVGHEDGTKQDDSSSEEIRDSNALDADVFEEIEEKADEEEFKAAISDNTASEFDSLWAEEDHAGDSENRVDTSLEDGKIDDNGSASSDKAGVVAGFDGDDTHKDTEPAFVPQVSPLKTKSPGRDTDHPWETPKYRRHLNRPETAKRTSSTPADFIDPTIMTTKTTTREPTSQGLGVEESGHFTVSGENDDHVEEKASDSLLPAVKATPTEAATAAQKSAASISAVALLALKSIEETEQSSPEPPPELKSIYQSKDPPGWNAVSKNGVTTPPRIGESKSFEDNRSQASEDSFGTGAIKLKHSYPGSDPTLRIQVHNDLIAWESKRRSEKSELLGYYVEKWQATRSLLQEGLEEVEFAERFVSGFAKAGVIFSDSTRAVCDDKMLDDSGNTVSNSFLQNRLYKKRNLQTQEYSIDTQDPTAESGQSALLNSILEAQLEIANSFRDCSLHVENEILPELRELLAEMQAEAKEFATLGDSIVGELKRSEIELKNIWGKFFVSFSLLCGHWTCVFTDVFFRRL